MAYEPTNWQTGDVITAEKLNKLEGGVKSLDPFIITASFDEDEKEAWDKTFAEIIAAKANGGLIYFKDTINFGDDAVPFPILSVAYYEGDSYLAIQAKISGQSVQGFQTIQLTQDGVVIRVE